MSTILSVENLSKRFWIGERQERGARHLLEKVIRNPISLFQKVKNKEFWALKDLSFEIQEGSRFGIIGRNGAGKSTLLKVISRISLPTTGRIEINGRVGSLLEVGTGFHPELTGRENIFLNGALLGMKRAEIAEKFDDIVEFAEVAQFLDTPVKRYSSGMYVRLAFSIAVHLQTEVLIVDEVLAVGDSRFQKKCIEKMNEVGRAGRTILFVSHNLALLQSVCTHGLVLEAGKQIGFGTIDEALSLYQKRHLQSTAAERGTTDLLALPRGAGRQTCFKSALLKHSPEALPNQVFIEEEISLTLQAQLPEAASEDLHVLVRWTTELGATVFSLSSMFQHGPIDKARELAAQCTFKVPPLIAGIYYLSFELYSKDSIIDELPSALMLEVAHHDYYRLGFQLPTHLGSTLVKASWKINS